MGDEERAEGHQTGDYLHSPVELPRDRVLQRAADAPWASDHGHAAHFPTPSEVLARLELPTGRWSVARCETADREAEVREGQRGTLTDSVVLVRRVGEAPGGRRSGGTQEGA